MPQPIRVLLRGLLGAYGGLIGCPEPCLPACPRMHVCMYVCVFVCTSFMWDQLRGPTHPAFVALMSVMVHTHTHTYIDRYVYLYATVQWGGSLSWFNGFFWKQVRRKKLTLWWMDAERCVCEKSPPVSSHHVPSPLTTCIIPYIQIWDFISMYLNRQVQLIFSEITNNIALSYGHRAD